MAKLDFPANPVLDQEYKFPPFTYRWDGEKWKTLGRGSTPVEDAIDEHKADSNAHDLALIGALPANGSAPMTGPLNIQTDVNEALTLNYSAGKDGGHLRGREAGDLDWYVGRANASGHVALYSNKLANGLIIRDSFIETVKPLRMGQDFAYYYNQRAGSADLNDMFSSLHCGVYYQDANAAATPERHYPLAEAGTLLVTGSAYGVQQEYTTFTTNRKFVRGQGAAGGKTWYAWREIGGPKDYIAGYNIAITSIPAGGSTTLIPNSFGGNYNIDSSGGSGVYNIKKTAVYRIGFGYSLEPQTFFQQSTGSVLVNGTTVFQDVVYNYTQRTSATSDAQMAVTPFHTTYKLNAGDRVSFQVKSVNNTALRVWRAGFITIEELNN